MASPLPKTKAPALVKNQRMSSRTPNVAVAPKPVRSRAGHGALQRALLEPTKAKGRRGGGPRHRGPPAIGDVEGAQGHRHEERRCDEGDADRCGAPHPAVCVPEA